MKRKTNTDPVLQEEISGTTQSVRTIIMSMVTKKLSFMLETWDFILRIGIMSQMSNFETLLSWWQNQENRHNPYIKAMSAVFEGYSSNLTNYCSTPYPAGEKFSLELEFQYFAKGKLVNL